MYSHSQGGSCSNPSTVWEVLTCLKLVSRWLLAAQKALCRTCGTGDAASSKPDSKLKNACCSLAMSCAWQKAAPYSTSTVGRKTMSFTNTRRPACTDAKGCWATMWCFGGDRSLCTGSWRYLICQAIRRAAALRPEYPVSRCLWHYKRMQERNPR